MGVPAGPLLNSKWIDLAAKLGFSFLTYKTIRSGYHPSHSLPNVAFVDWNSENETLYTCRENQKEDISITNSFGMPSLPLDFLAEDIQRSMNLLSDKQMLAVSITGTETKDTSYIKDLCYLIRFLLELKVPAIEVNFSCPNIFKKGGDLYLDESSIESIGKELVKCAEGTPLILKVGPYPSDAKLSTCLQAMANSGFQGVCGINSIKKMVKEEGASFALGKDRTHSGICGDGIFSSALHFVESAKKCIENQKLDLEIIATGGASKPSHFDEFFNRGAKIAQTATGMMWNPYLAHNYLSQSNQLAGCSHE